MRSLKRKGSYVYLPNNDNETENQILKRLDSSYSKTKWTDRICFLINYCSLIITLVYNSYWIYIFQNIIPNIQEDQTKNCPVVMNWNNYYSTWVIVSLIKAVFLLLFAPMGVGSEFDCNFFLLAIKMLSSVIPCVCFILMIPYHGVNIFNKITEGECFKLYENLTLFYQWEKTYFILLYFNVRLSTKRGI